MVTINEVAAYVSKKIAEDLDNILPDPCKQKTHTKEEINKLDEISEKLYFICDGEEQDWYIEKLSADLGGIDLLPEIMYCWRETLQILCIRRYQQNMYHDLHYFCNSYSIELELDNV